MRRWPLAREAELRAVLAPLADAPDGLICDMPSGGCYLAKYIRPGMRYLGVEPVDGFFAASDDECGARLVASIEDVPLPDGAVDYIVSLAGLHHEPNLPRVFEEMHRLMRPGGRMVIADVETDTPPARFLNGFVANNNPLGHDGRFLDASTCRLLAESGLTVIDDAMVAVPWSFGSKKDAAAFCADLFGIAGSGRQTIADALADQIGFYTDGPLLNLRWVLRRIVAQRA